ncbi:hypothetical protein ES703_119772 [subsurface metagenome]
MQDREAKAIKRIAGSGTTETRLTYSIPEAAARIGISSDLAYELAKRGELAGAIRLGRKRWVVSRVQLERFLEGAGGHEG